MLTEDEYLLALRKKIDALKARAELPRYKYSEKEQAKIVAHFVDRAIQIGEASFRIKDLPIPLNVLIRVLCDDLIRLFWSCLSESNAAECAKAPVSEMARILRLSLEKGYARVVNEDTQQDASAEVLPELSQYAHKRKNIEQIAIECGLDKLYAIPFRFSSLAVHGNTYDLDQSSGYSALVTLPAIIAFLGAIMLVVDSYPNRSTSAKEVLRTLGIDNAGVN